MSDPQEPRDDTDRSNDYRCPLCEGRLDTATRLILNDDTITGIALVPAMTIARRFGVPPPAYDEVLAQVKWAITEGLRIANND